METEHRLVLSKTEGEDEGGYLLMGTGFLVWVMKMS